MGSATEEHAEAWHQHLLAFVSGVQEGFEHDVSALRNAEASATNGVSDRRRLVYLTCSGNSSPWFK